MPKTIKKPKKRTPEEIKKWKKESKACHHNRVGYPALQKLALGMFKRSKQDAENIKELSLSNYRLARSLDRNTRLMDLWKKANKKNVVTVNEREELWKSRCEALTKLVLDWKRKYEGLFGLKESAESMGIDTENHVATEEDKQFIKDYNFEHTATQLESGRTKNIFNLKKKRPEGYYYFGKFIPGKKPQKPNGENK